MSTAQVKAALTTTDKKKPTTIATLLQSPSFQQQMALALPKHVTPDRMARIALTEVRRVPKLAQADQVSFMAAVMTCAQLGLEPGAGLGQAYLIPHENRKKGIVEVTLIVGYRGLLDLARRSGQIKSIEARTIFAKDQYRIEYGLHPTLEHRPAWDEPDRGPIRFFYAVATMVNGGQQFEVMSKVEVDRIRARSRSGNDGPWVTDYEPMGQKTVLRKLCKLLPTSSELQRAVILDELAEAGVSQQPAFDDDAYSPPPLAIEHAPENEPATPQQLRELLHKAQSVADLDLVGNVLDRVEDEKERADLTAVYGARRKMLVAKETAEDQQQTKDPSS